MNHSIRYPDGRQTTFEEANVRIHSQSNNSQSHCSLSISSLQYPGSLGAWLLCCCVVTLHAECGTSLFCRECPRRSMARKLKSPPRQQVLPLPLILFHSVSTRRSSAQSITPVVAWTKIDTEKLRRRWPFASERNKGTEETLEGLRYSP